MNAAQDLLEQARRLGVEVTSDGERLNLRAKTPPPEDFLDALRRHKAEVVELLAANDTWSEEEEERAAIIAEGTGCPIAWAEGLARLDPNAPPADVPRPYWRALCNAAGEFVDTWAAKAESLGWTVHDCFGCDIHAPFARLDRQGLVWSLVGAKLVSITATAAVIELPSGARQTYRKRPDAEPARAALAWTINPE